MLVLERTADAAARGRRGYAHLAGAGLTSDAHDPTAPSPGGEYAEAALRAALTQAGLSPADVDHVNAHGTSTPLNDRTEAELIARVLPHGPSVTAPKGVLGHSLGASGAVETALTALDIRDSRVAPIANLASGGSGCGSGSPFDIDCATGTVGAQRVSVAVSQSFGFGGHNVVLLLTAP